MGTRGPHGARGDPSKSELRNPNEKEGVRASLRNIHFERKLRVALSVRH